MLVCFVVFLHEMAFFKPMLFVFFQVFYIMWAGWTKPHDDRWYNFLEKLNEWGTLCIGYIMFLQTAFMKDQEVKYYMGWGAIWICLIIYFFNFISMLFVFLRELRHAYRMYSVKRKFILQYSRKGMIEQNYFKSSKDTGPKSKLGKKLASMGSSSRDGGSPRKDRRRRRRRDYDNKSSLVAKNDVDDVAESGFDDDQMLYSAGTAGGLDYSSKSKKQSKREYKRQLRDAETAHKLQQIAEVEGEESDDGFGPKTAKQDEDDGAPSQFDSGLYQPVSNRSTVRGANEPADE